MSSSGNTNADLATLKEAIVRALDVKAWYEKRLRNGEILTCASDGWSEHVHCAIHNDTGKPNLSINILTGGFRCFSCSAAGSIFDFWCLSQGLDRKIAFRDALVELANEAGIKISEFQKTAKPTVAPVDADPNQVSEQIRADENRYVLKLNKTEAADTSKAPIPQNAVDKYVSALKSEHFKYLTFQRGFTDTTIKRYEIGWDDKKKYKDNDGLWRAGKITLPIRCRRRLIRNVRVYAQDCSSAKMINTKGFGSPSRVFPLHELLEFDWQHLIICEGEWDTILMNQKLFEADLNGMYGWGAICNTAGCNTFEPEWIPDLLKRSIYFMFDVDDPGKTWASSIATQHFLGPLSTGNTPLLKIIHLPLDGSKDSKDITDYFVRRAGELEPLLELIKESPELKVGGVNRDEASVEAIEIQSFVECIKDRKYIDQRVQVPITISGQSTKLYHAARVIRVSKCPKMKDDACCNSGAGVQVIPYGDPAFIESCGANKRQIQSTLQGMACLLGEACTVEEVEKVVMEEYFGHQVIKRLVATENEDGRMVNSQELVTTPVYILQPEKNQEIGPHDYLATGYVRSHPQTRVATLFVEHLEPMEDDWRKFAVNAETIPKLKQIQNYGGVKKLLDDITNGVTQIYESDDILLAILLTYLSPLSISFNGDAMRGWLNTCVIGDSGTGKSATYIRVSDWLELGDLFSALSGTRTGLLYSIKQKGVEWYVQIGRYVMASGKIIAIDETQETTPEEIKKMAIAMDKGWLEVSQVASGGYHTQTRTIFLMNPKLGKKISDFSYGCLSLAECFDPMFIRRIDLAIFSTGKTDHAFYNQRHNPATAKQVPITAETFRALVYWAWTREMGDIQWSDEATQTCLDSAIELSAIFGNADDIPLVSPQDFRNNLARVSTAFAILSGAFTEDYTGAAVKPEHVKAMARFFNACYSSGSCNLKQHSKNSGKKKTLRDYDIVRETIVKVVEHAAKHPDRRFSEGQHFLQMLLLIMRSQLVRQRDLLTQLGVSPRWVQKHLAILAMHDLIESKRGYYLATRKFNLFMQQWQTEEGVEELLDRVQEKVGKQAMLTLDEYSDLQMGDSSQEPDDIFDKDISSNTGSDISSGVSSRNF